MARNFVAASSQYLEVASTFTTRPCSVMCWYRPTTNTTQTLVSLGQAGTNHYRLIGVQGTNLMLAQEFDNVAATSAAIVATLTTGVWHFCGAVFNSATDRRLYHDATKATDVGTSTPAALNTTTIGSLNLSSRVNFTNGDIAEVAIWNVALSDADMAILALGISPLLVRPDALVRYYPLLGSYSPEIDVVGGAAVTVTGATVATHPRMVYAAGPRTKRITRDPAVMGGNVPLTWTPTAALVAPFLFGGALTLPFAVVGNLVKADTLTVLIAGTERSGLVNRFDSEILDQLNDTANTATLMVRGFTPTVGQQVTVLLGPTKLFEGLVTDLEQVQRRAGTRLRYRLNCIDWTFLLDRRLVTTSYLTQSASTIAASLITTSTSGFTTTNVEAALASVDMPNKMERVSQALTRLANLVGAFWYIDYDKDLHFRITENLTNPAALDTTNKTYRDLRYHRNITPVRTRVYVEGYGSALPISIPSGSTAIPLNTDVDAGVFGVSGQVFVDGLFVTFTGQSSGVSVQTSGVTAAGATTMGIGDTTLFVPPGWVSVPQLRDVMGGFGQLVYYTGRSVASGVGNLTGIPASGVGAIVEDIPAFLSVGNHPALTGCSGVTRAVTEGAPINLVVTVNDVAAQTALAALEGGDGIVEHFIQDRRLSVAGATSRGTAELTLGKDPDEIATFISEDPNMCSGRSVAITISGISTTLKIQQVRIFWTADRALPQREVTATNRFKDFYQYVRDIEANASKAS